jgi:hypothetical protein
MMKHHEDAEAIVAEVVLALVDCANECPI